MARRRREQGEAVSLFPFLSILACVIGTLTLMITALALGQIDEGESPDARARVETAGEVELQTEITQSRIDDALRAIAEYERTVEELRAAEAEIERLKQAETDATRASAELRENTAELAEVAELRGRIPELEAELPELADEVAKLEAAIVEKGKPREAEVVVQPGGTGIDIVPTFVEVTANGVAIHSRDAEPERIRRADLNHDGGRFHELLDTVAGTPKGRIVFLVREDAVGTYNAATAVCRSHYGPNGYASHGKLPIIGQGRIDLRLFEAPE